MLKGLVVVAALAGATIVTAEQACATVLQAGSGTITSPAASSSDSLPVTHVYYYYRRYHHYHYYHPYHYFPRYHHYYHHYYHPHYYHPHYYRSY